MRTLEELKEMGLSDEDIEKLIKLQERKNNGESLADISKELAPITGESLDVK